MRRLIFSTLLFGAGCSLSALDGFSTSAPRPSSDGGDAPSSGSTSGSSSIDASGASTKDGGGSDGGGTSACLPGSTADSICDDFDLGSPNSGWSASAPTGSYTIVSTGRSQPNAMAFSHPNGASTSTVGPTLAKTFGGAWSNVECAFSAALDEVPANGTADFYNVGTGGPTADEAGIRLYATGFRVITCRNGSNCKPEVAAGTLPTIGEFHSYRAVWKSTGEFSFYLDGELRGTITTIAPLTSPLTAGLRLGVPYRVYGTGGAFRLRLDDIDCRRTP